MQKMEINLKAKNPNQELQQLFIGKKVMIKKREIARNQSFCQNESERVKSFSKQPEQSPQTVQNNCQSTVRITKRTSTPTKKCTNINDITLNQRIKTQQNDFIIETQKDIEGFLQEFRNLLIIEIPKLIQNYQQNPFKLKIQFKKDLERLKLEKQKKCEKLENLKNEYKKFIQSDGQALSEEDFQRINIEKLEEIQHLSSFKRECDQLLFQSQKTLSSINSYVPKQLEIVKELDTETNQLYEEIRQRYPTMIFWEK